MDLNDWLERHGLTKYAELFAEHAIGLDVLPQLIDQELKELSIPLGDRKRLLKAAVELSGGSESGPNALAVDNRSVGAGIADQLPSHEGERRQRTVLFCDMVGFTELANRVDPEILQKIIRSYEDACAVCIATATGLVVVSFAEKGAVGETMNLASRLQGIAQPGSIVVSERVHRLAGGSFDYEDLGEQTLKGIAQPTHAYRILGVSEAASRFEAATQEGLTPLFGRDLEIGLLLERWQLARDGERSASAA